MKATLMIVILTALFIVIMLLLNAEARKSHDYNEMLRNQNKPAEVKKPETADKEISEQS